MAGDDAWMTDDDGAMARAAKADGGPRQPVHWYIYIPTPGE